MKPREGLDLLAEFFVQVPDVRIKIDVIVFVHL